MIIISLIYTMMNWNKFYMLKHNDMTFISEWTTEEQKHEYNLFYCNFYFSYWFTLELGYVFLFHFILLHKYVCACVCVSIFGPCFFFLQERHRFLVSSLFSKQYFLFSDWSSLLILLQWSQLPHSTGRSGLMQRKGFKEETAGWHLPKL